jgi:protocatechuate 3,4-dioxygenase beta subunit
MKTLMMRTAYIFSLCMLLHVNASGQAASASLTGTVLDQSGGSVVGSEVKLKALETDVVLSATTEANGLYSFPNLPPGRYELRATARGFREYVQTGIRADLGARLRIDGLWKLGPRPRRLKFRPTHRR